MKATVTRIDKRGSYLFAVMEDGRTVFVHASAFDDRSTEGLRLSDQIEIDRVEVDARGPRAHRAERLEEQPDLTGQRLRGRISRLRKDRGFAFIRCEPTGEFFLHESTINNYRFDDLREGDEVEFSVIDSDRGVRAHDVDVVALVEAS